MITRTRRLLPLGIALLLISVVAALLYFPRRSNENLPAVQIDTPQAHSTRAVIFDLNDVLFSLNQQQALTHLGFLDVIAYTTVQGKKISNLQDKVTSILHELRGQFTTPHCASSQHESLQPLLDGAPLPHVMRDWMQGELSGKEILDKGLPYINSLQEEKFFCSSQEKTLTKKALHLIFDPQTRCSIYHPIKQGVELLKQCKALGHRVYLLTNMDCEFMDQIKNKHPKIFELFDGIIVSAEVKALKPYPGIYKHLLKKYDLHPSQCYLIDDQAENIVGARNLGLHAIRCEDKNFAAVRKELKKLMVLPEK